VRGTVTTVAVVCAALALGACGGDSKRQDANEERRDYKVAVVTAEFPEQQKLAKRSEMEIAVKNVDTAVIPDVAITVKSFDTKNVDKSDTENSAVSVQPQRADPRTAIFVVNQSPVEFSQELGKGDSSLVDREVDPPRGTDNAGSAYVDTYALGSLKPGETKIFRWDVTAVVAGPFKLDYRVEAGFDGKAKAVLEDGGIPKGVFEGVIDNRAPEGDVDFDDGTTILRDNEAVGPKPPDTSNGPNDD